MTKVKDMRFPCHLYGRIHDARHRVRTLSRYFDGHGIDIKKRALELLKERADEGSPWYGDSVTVVDPRGLRTRVDVPWPGDD